MGNTYDIDKLDAFTGDEKIVHEAKTRFRRCEDWEANARELFEDDNKFVHGDSDNGYQWPDTVRLNRDQRPCLTINKTRQHNLQIINDAKQNKPSVKIRPVGDNATFEAAEVYQGIIRHIEYISNAQVAYDTATTFQVNCGIGYWRIVTDYAGDDSFDQEIFIRRIKNPLSIYIDPDINEKDGSDARYAFIFDDMPVDEFKASYPKYMDMANTSMFGNKADNWIDDHHVRVAEYYRAVEKKDTLIALKDPNTGETSFVRKSKLNKELVDAVVDDPTTKTRSITDTEIEWLLIVGHKIAERKKWPGRYIPIVRIVGEEYTIDGKLDRKGHTRNLKDPQRMYNYWTSSATEQVALQGKSPYVGPAAAIEGYEPYWNTANVTNYSVLPYNHLTDEGKEIPAPERAQPAVMADAFLKGMEVSANEMMMVSGQYESTFGEPSNERSGKAINERQRQGDRATYHFIDNNAVGIRFTGKILLDLIPKIYDTKRIIKILAEDGTETDIQLDPQAQQAHQMQENKQEQKASIIFNPNIGKYDVMADVGPGYATKRMEAFNALSAIMQENPEIAKLVGDLWAENSDFPTADKVAERFRNMLPPQALGQGMPPGMQQMQEQMGNIQKILQECLEENAKLKLDIKAKDADRKVDNYEAITKRLDALLSHVVRPCDGTSRTCTRNNSRTTATGSAMTQIYDAEGRPVKVTNQTEAMCHKGIENIAKEMAGAFYERAAHDDHFYRKFPNQKVFINKNWKGFVKTARSTLADMLSMNKFSEKDKEMIADMLFLDRTLPGSQTRVIN